MRAFALLLACCAAALGACDNQVEEGILEVAFIATGENLFTSGLRMSEPAQHIRAAKAMGLVTRDARGEIVPGLADRWIVTDDGRSFIFRLRDGTWPDGSELTAQSVRASLLAAMEELQGTSMELDLEPVEEVRAMAGRVVELRLSGPFPALLQLLAQPELALAPEQGTGAMRIEREAATALLTLKPPAARGLPEDEDWASEVRPVRVIALSAPEALARFDDGEVDAVLGGDIGNLPLVDVGPLSRGTIRIDPAIGLFGLRVQRETGPLAQEELREAISMAIDRPALIAPFGVAGWTPTTRVVNPGLPGDPGYIAERWADQSIEERRAEAARRLAAWRAAQDELEEGEPVTLSLAIGEQAGYDILFRELASQLASIGIRLERVPEDQQADLALIDRIARYAAPRWFLNQLRCALQNGLCDEEADELIALAVDEQDLAARATLLAEAEAELTLANVYIPFGTPLRWSLIRSDVDGFLPNRWAFHPLPPLATVTR